MSKQRGGEPRIARQRINRELFSIRKIYEPLEGGDTNASPTTQPSHLAEHLRRRRAPAAKTALVIRDLLLAEPRRETFLEQFYDLTWRPGVENEANNAFRPSDRPLTEYEEEQKALRKNLERLRAERLAREKAKLKDD